MRGATAGALDWGKEQILEFVEKLRDRRLAFVQDNETIGLVRHERLTEEYTRLRAHIQDKKLRELVVLGLTLRRLENHPDDAERLQGLRKRILKRHGVNGLQAAELVQRGIVFTLLNRFVANETEAEDIHKALENLLKRVGQHAAFVKLSDNAKALVAELKVKVIARSPDLFMVLGHGEAKEKAQRVVDALLKALPKGFGAERFDIGKDFCAFIGKMEDGGLAISLPV